MKKIFVILFGFMAYVINAQTRVESLNKRKEREQGVYYKDLDNELTPYVGTWIANIKGKTFQITFEKVKEFHEFNKYWRDRIHARYEMKDSNGKILYSTYNSKIKVKSIGFADKRTRLVLLFLDKCIQGDIYLKFTDSTKSKIEWEYEDIPQTIAVLEGETPNCAKVYEMPQEKFILVKQ